MALVLENSIDGYQFEDLQGNVPKRGQELDIFIRPGIDGVGARKTGKRTGPIQLISHRYLINWQDAEDAIVNYKALVGAEPVTVVQHDIDYGTYLVVAVDQVSAFAVYSVAGNTIVTNPQVKQICQWTVFG